MTWTARLNFPNRIGGFISVDVTYLLYRDIYVAHREIPGRQGVSVIRKDSQTNSQSTSVVQIGNSTAQSRVTVRQLRYNLNANDQSNPLPTAPKLGCYLAARAAVRNTNSLHKWQYYPSCPCMDPVFTIVAYSQLQPRAVHPNTETLAQCNSAHATAWKIGYTAALHAKHIHRRKSMENLHVLGVAMVVHGRSSHR